MYLYPSLAYDTANSVSPANMRLQRLSLLLKLKR